MRKGPEVQDDAEGGARSCRCCPGTTEKSTASSAPPGRLDLRTVGGAAGGIGPLRGQQARRMIARTEPNPRLPGQIMGFRHGPA